MTSSSTHSGTITVKNSTFSARTLNNNGTFEVYAGSGSEPEDKVSTLTIEAMTGNAIQVKNSITLKDTTVGGANGAVEVQSGLTVTLDGANTITTFDLSAAAGVGMDWQDSLSFTGLGDDYSDKLTINMAGYSGGTYCLLDSQDGSWTEDMYQALLTNEWNPPVPPARTYKLVVKDGDLYVKDYYHVAYATAGGNDSKATPADPNFLTVGGAVGVDPDEIVIKDGTYGDVTELCGIRTTIQETGGLKTRFTRGVFGGVMETSGAGEELKPVKRDIDLEITGGTFEKIVTRPNC